jgi:hypothetical protein
MLKVFKIFFQFFYMSDDRRGVRLKDCRLCKKYDHSKSVEVQTFICRDGYFDYTEDDDGVRGRISKGFDCKGAGYVFNPESPWRSILKDL